MGGESVSASKKQAKQRIQGRNSSQRPPRCQLGHAPVEAVGHRAAAGHQLEQQQQRLGGHAKGAGVDEAEERVRVCLNQGLHLFGGDVGEGTTHTCVGG